MAVYVVAQLSFKDPESYDRYQRKFFDVFRKFDGTFLAADESPQVLEGTWERDKIVMMSFPDEASCRAFRESPEYREIAVDRNRGADGIVLLVKGFTGRGQ